MDVNTLFEVYSRSDRLAALTSRQFQLLYALNQESLHFLAEEVYRLAAEDLELCQTKKPNSDAQYRHDIESMSRDLIKDSEEERHVEKLLLTVDKSILEAIILNTVGHQYISDGSFYRKIPQLDTCGGAYLLTLVGDEIGVKRKDQGFTRTHWRWVRSMITKYHTGDLSDEKTLGLVAKMERMYARRGDDIEAVKADLLAGRKLMIWEGAKTFCKLLHRRIDPEHDPTGTVRQIQAPLQVGCSVNLKQRIARHYPKGTLSSSSIGWKLLLSCFNALNIKYKAVCIPIFKIWDSKQLDISEHLLTVLGGSLVYDGGLNAIQSGQYTKLKENIPGFLAAQRQIGLTTWFKKNLKELEEYRERQALSMIGYIQGDQHQQLGHIAAPLEQCLQMIEKQMNEYMRNRSRIVPMDTLKEEAVEDERNRQLEKCDQTRAAKLSELKFGELLAMHSKKRKRSQVGKEE